MDWEDILPAVERPGRYIGGEVNSVRKNSDACRLRFALASPDVYEVGMSHLGLQILYAVLNGRPEISAERFYAPWPDMEELMRKNRICLASMESRIPLHSFDIVGFSLQYELSYTNVLAMLELGGIPVRSEDRREEHPLVIAGGPCAFNPAPMSDFIDAFAIGEGEEVVLEIAGAVMEGKKKKKRSGILEDLAQIKGVYVPSVHTGKDVIRKRIISDLDAWPFPTRPVVPLIKTIHDRAVLEIARGCTRGCRFCQAGMVWRPVRERRPEVLTRMAEELLCGTGYGELSLLSLSAGDYSLIEPLLADFMDRFYGRRVAMALPSLRVETLTKRLIDAIRRVKKTSFTLAPEAGTQRLRNIINKDNTEADLMNTAGLVFAAGWRAIKLYFMIGLPSETAPDLEGIADLAYRVLKEAKSKGRVAVSLSTFVPKPHTPFQWHEQMGLEETLEKQFLIKKHIRSSNLAVKWHDAKMSLLEGILSRGDERLGLLIEDAFRRGCRFDGWSDRLRFDLWEEAMSARGITASERFAARDPEESLPWERIDCGIDRSFLLREREKARSGESTEDCRLGKCQSCGVCDGEAVKIAIARGGSAVPPFAAHEAASEKTAGRRRFLFEFVKRRPARFLSHLEIAAVILRAITMSGLPLVYSQGFHPHPRISFAFATAVGQESCGEYGEILMEDPPIDVADHVAKINAALPEGVEITDMKSISSFSPSLSEMIAGFVFEAFLPEEMAADGLSLLHDRIERFLDAATFFVERERKGKRSVKDLRRFVESLTLCREERKITMSVRNGRDGTLGPFDILTLVAGLEGPLVRRMRVVKTGTRLLSCPSSGGEPGRK